MTFKPYSGLIALLIAAFCALTPAPATAQSGRDNVYTVSGVQVDQTATNAASAQESAFAGGRRAAFDRLVRRLTIPEELSARAAPAPDATALDRLVLSVDVADERRSSTRYTGRLTVRFDPGGVRTLLRGQGLTVVDTRTAPILLAPQAAPGTAPEIAVMWRDVWTQGGFGEELAPLAIAPDTLRSGADWRAAQPFAQAAAAASAVYATLRVQGGTASVTLVEVAGEQRRERGEVSARVGEDPASLRAGLNALAEAASARVQNEWKARVATGSGQRARVSASALYADERQWERIKQALEGAAQTLISEIRIEAVAREGALVSFSFVGDRAQLVAELSRRGVRLEDSPSGPLLRVQGN
jgi:hypothetical protein